METLLWILQGILAFAFLAAGTLKLTKSKADLVHDPRLSWTEDFGEGQIKGIGALEIAGALGLILPAALDVVPILTPLAATGLVLTMIGAARVHLRRGETQAVPPPAVLGLMALIVAVLRFGPNAL